jgi:hypothetical protein
LPQGAEKNHGNSIARIYGALATAQARQNKRETGLSDADAACLLISNFTSLKEVQT